MNLESAVLAVKCLAPKAGDILLLSYPRDGDPGPIVRILRDMKIPEGVQVVLMPEGYTMAIADPPGQIWYYPPAGGRKMDVERIKELARHETIVAKGKSTKEAAADRLKALAGKIERKERAPRNEWREAAQDLRRFLKITEEPSGFISGYETDFSGGCPVSDEMCRHILFYAGYRDAPAVGSIGPVSTEVDYYAEPVTSQRVYGGPVEVSYNGEKLGTAIGPVEVSMPPPKSEARLALEYDLRQAIPVSEGGEIDRAIAQGPDWLLEKAKYYLGLEQLGHAGAAQELFAWAKMQ